MLKKAKQATLNSLKTVGLLRMVQQSNWRRRRLLILGYHGVSVLDEHLWNGAHFVSEDVFRTRLQLIKKSRCAVLSFEEAIDRLYANDLPDRALTITFDDGTTDFYTKAFPLLREFEFPVTLYLTTYYSDHQQPVFDLMSSYLLWKGRAEVLDLTKITGQNSKTQLSDQVTRETVAADIRTFAHAQKLSASDKEMLARSLAAQLKVDYDELLERRALHILTPDQVKEVAAQGVDVQLHTHRHRTPQDRNLFVREIEDNRKSIFEMTGRRATHFCYPNGVYEPEFFPWLEELGVLSATTCDTGLATSHSHPLGLPRVLDVSSLSPIEFEGWLTGVSAALPRRAVRATLPVRKIA